MFREAMKSLELKMIPVSDDVSANTLSAILYPGGVTAADFMRSISTSDVILAGGLLPELKDKYFRVGHMGAVTAGDILATASSVERALKECGYVTG